MKSPAILKIIGNAEGIAVVIIALAMAAIIGFICLVIDLGNAYVVKGQLQNAADAGALAGAGALYQIDPTHPLPVTVPPPDWDSAKAKAAAFVKQNKAAGALLSDAQIQYGYWNLATKTWDAPPVTSGNPPAPSSGNCSITTSATCTVSTSCPKFPSESCIFLAVPTVLVTVNKSDGENGGPLATFFGGAVGVGSIALSASGTAARGAPSSVSGAFPFALNGCIVTDYFSQNPLPNPPPQITDTSVYHLKDGTAVSMPGQWTDLKQAQDPSASLLVSYIDNMINPSNGAAAPTIQAGNGSSTYLYIDPGTKASVYHDTQSLVDAGKGLVIMPVVATPPDCSMTPGSDMLVTGFVAFQITGTTNSSMTGRIINYYVAAPGSSIGGGLSNNAISSPVLIK